LEKLVLNFSDEYIRAIGINNLNEIILIEEVASIIDFGKDISYYKNNTTILSEISQLISSILNTDISKIKKTGVVIDSAQAFLNIIPVDSNDDEKTVNSQIMWEISNYFPETYNDFNIKCLRLNNHKYSGNIDEALLIAIDKFKIDFCRKACAELKLNLKAVEIDHFAAEKVLSDAYKEKISANVLLIGFKNERIDLSVVNKGKIRYYEYINKDDNEYHERFIHTLKNLPLNIPDLNLKDIFVYGGDLTVNIDDSVMEIFKNVPVTVIDPFYKIKLSRELLSEKSGDKNLHRFTPLCGLASKMN
jgi:Tfp pilus assembly PilM family ATPase